MGMFSTLIIWSICLVGNTHVSWIPSTLFSKQFAVLLRSVKWIILCIYDPILPASCHCLSRHITCTIAIAVQIVSIVYFADTFCNYLRRIAVIVTITSGYVINIAAPFSDRVTWSKASHPTPNTWYESAWETWRESDHSQLSGKQHRKEVCWDCCHICSRTFEVETRHYI